MQTLMTIRNEKVARRRVKQEERREPYRRRMREEGEKRAGREKRERDEYWRKEGKKRGGAGVDACSTGGSRKRVKS